MYALRIDTKNYVAANNILTFTCSWFQYLYYVPAACLPILYPPPRATTCTEMGALPRNSPPPTCTRIQDTREAISGGVLDTDSIYVLHGCLAASSIKVFETFIFKIKSNRATEAILKS